MTSIFNPSADMLNNADVARPTESPLNFNNIERKPEDAKVVDADHPPMVAGEQIPESCLGDLSPNIARMRLSFGTRDFGISPRYPDMRKQPEWIRKIVAKATGFSRQRIDLTKMNVNTITGAYASKPVDVAHSPTLAKYVAASIEARKKAKRAFIIEVHRVLVGIKISRRSTYVNARNRRKK